MSPEQRARIEESWRRALPSADSMAKLFYERLFQTDPSTRLLFEGVGMEGQRTKFMQVLAVIVGSLGDPTTLNDILEEMGERHAHYGVVEPQYRSLGAALLWALEQTLGPAWTGETRDAWAALYATISNAMRRGARRT